MARNTMQKEIIVGGVIVGIIALLIVGMFVFQWLDPFMLTFTIRFDEAKKLQAGDFIYAQGNKIGEVNSVELDDAERVILAEVMIDKDRNIPIDSIFFIWPDKWITGRKSIQVKYGKNTIFIRKGDTITGESSALGIIKNVGIKWLKSAGLIWNDIQKELKDMGSGFENWLQDLTN